MKTLGRILIILAVAALIGGAAYLLFGSNGAALPAGFAEQHVRGRDGFDGALPGGFPAGEGFERDGHAGRGESGSFASLGFSMLGNLLIIAVIVIVWSLLSRLARRMRGERVPARAS
jgi:hypothetical protein